MPEFVDIVPPPAIPYNPARLPVEPLLLKKRIVVC